MSLAYNGVATEEQIFSKFPSVDLLAKPKAIIECYEDIPCNPCSTSCPFGAITIGADINKQPLLDASLCTGCAICVHSCPGLAIMVVEVKGEFAKFKIPYEFSSVPLVGETWKAVNRNGEVIGTALIDKVNSRIKQDKTLIIEVLVDKNLLYTFSTIRKD
jgi:MinD superfamily P-loop ATPase